MAHELRRLALRYADLVLARRFKPKAQPEDINLQLTRFARFAETSISKMLAFADVLVADNTWQPTDRFARLAGVHICVSAVPEIIVPSFKHRALWTADSEEMEGLARKTDDVLSSTKDRLEEAILRIWGNTEAVTPALRSDSWESLPQNAEIHQSTRLIVDYARSFLKYSRVMKPIIRRSPDVSRLNVRMFRNLKEQLEKKSESFSDSSLRYLFLLNNSYYIHTQYQNPDHIYMHGQYLIYEHYQEDYMRVSWEPVLSCLRDKMQLCFPRHASPLARFESEFQKTSRHQKMWKVPDPKLRTRLREAIIHKVITAYKEYLEDHPEQDKCSSDPPRISLQDMEEMVNDLFEG